MQLGEVIASISTVSLFSTFMQSEPVQSIFLVMSYDEQYYSTKSRLVEASSVKKRAAQFKQVYDIHAVHEFKIYTVGQPFFVYLYVLTKTGLQKCVGVAKIDNLALQAITNKQRGGQGDDNYSILFFPNSHMDSCTSNAIAESSVKCTYMPSVGVIERN